MLRVIRRPRSAGFTLIELIIVVVILGILLSVALPSFLTMLRNSEIRNAAESIRNGLQRARAEAVARNANVQFVIGTGSSWTVDYQTRPTGVTTPLDTRSSSEGSATVAVTALAPDFTTAATMITFNNVGQVVPNPTTTPYPNPNPQLARVNLAATGSTQNLRITIGAGGNAKVCDPNLTAGSSSRAC